MNTLANLKLVAAKRTNKQLPVVQRRNRLIAKIWEQCKLAEAQQGGKVFAPQVLRTIKNKETGERKTVEIAKRIKPWWWVAENGKLCLNVKYGTKVIELAKGKTAVELGTPAELIVTLETLKAAVLAGELDTQIETVSGALRSGFTTTKR